MIMMMKTMKLLMIVVLQLLMPLISPAYSTHIHSNSHPRNQAVQDLVAMEEMEKANYFTFVMLINMATLDDTIVQGNITFLMPHDSTLARVRIPNGEPLDFLQRHSIPSPLPFGSLLQLPTGTVMPSSLPGYMMRISNNGRKDFLLNNVRIISPNLCVSGSSIRCHGIDGLLTEETAASYNASPTAIPCPGTGPLPPSLSPSPPPHVYFDLAPAPAPPSETNTAPRKSGSSSWWKLQSDKGVVTRQYCTSTQFQMNEPRDYLIYCYQSILQ